MPFTAPAALSPIGTDHLVPAVHAGDPRSDGEDRGLADARRTVGVLDLVAEIDRRPRALTVT